ncbi:hypothetical protein GC176_07820 [bacterium]|nr:hypothetical protein [bacterium]
MKRLALMIPSLALLSRPAIAALCLTALAVSAEVATADVTLQQDGTTVKVTINDRPFSDYHTDSDLPKPFFSPVLGTEGDVLTRSILFDKKSGDHPHHKGIWVAVDEVGGVKFWAEAGKIANREVKLLVPSGNPAKMRVVNQWLDPDGVPVVTETTVISIFENGLLAYDIHFTSDQKDDVEFGDTKEGLFGFRMVDSMCEAPKGEGHVVNAEGLQGTKECWGQPSKWVDYVGPVNGHTYGVALFDHPGNFRPSRYHVRNYGLFSISPFGESAYTNKTQEAKPYYLKPDGELRLRYAIYIHAGDTEAADVSGVYDAYVKSGL